MEAAAPSGAPPAPAGATPPLEHPALRSKFSVPVCQGGLDGYDIAPHPAGKGGYAVVHKATRKSDGRVVAVKKVEIFDLAPRKRDRCLQEVHLLRQLSHPYIMRMLDAFIDNNQLIIICEWAPGGDLKGLLRRAAEEGKQLEEGQVWSYFLQVAEGLAAMHAMRIMHRDVKPANVLVGPGGGLKLGDLGLGRQLSQDTVKLLSKVGTPFYVSPEVVQGAEYGWSSDLWSLGCLLYELAALRSPFESQGATLYEVFQRISRCEYQPLPADRWSSPLRTLVARLLQHEPAKRPQLQEVCALARQVLATQARWRQDVHSVSEQLVDQLKVLADIATRANRSGSTSTTSFGAAAAGSSSGRRSSSASGRPAPAAASQGLPQPPAGCIAALHPYFFAGACGTSSSSAGAAGRRQPGQPPGAANPPRDGSGSSTADDKAAEADTAADGDGAADRSQLGVYAQLFAWLLRIIGRLELAQRLEAQLDSPHAANSSGASAPGGDSRSRTSSSPARTSTSAGRQQRRQSPRVPSRQAGAGRRLPLPQCRDSLKCAAQLLKALAALGISTDGVAPAALASGCGKAACGALQEVLEMALQKVQPCLPPLLPGSHQPLAAAFSGSSGGGGGGGGGGRAVTPAAGAAAEPWPDDDHDEDLGLPADELLGQQPGGSSPQDACWEAPGDGCSPGALSTAPAAGCEEQQAQVDPAAWRAELERLAPQLRHLQVAAGGSAAGTGAACWDLRLRGARAASAQLQEQAQQARPALARLGWQVGQELGGVEALEARLNSQLQQQVGSYRAGVAGLQQLRQLCGAAAEAASSRGGQLAELEGRAAEAQRRAQDALSGMDGASKLAAARDAIRAIGGELAQMDVRLGLLQRQALLRGCRG